MSNDQDQYERPKHVAELPTSAIPPGATHIKVEIDAVWGNVTWWAGVQKVIRNLPPASGRMERITWTAIEGT